MADADNRPYLSLIIPAYNEQGRIAGTLETVGSYLRSLGRPCEVIVVDDGSTDDTLIRTREYAAASDSVRIITYGRNAGKGYAVRQGVFASRGEFVAFSDADISAPIDELPKLFEALNRGFDIAIGSRAVKGTKIGVHQPFYRELGGKALNLLIQMLAVPGIKDTQCGFKLFRGDAARGIFGMCFLDGWAFDVEVLHLARRLGYSIAEVPVRWSHAEGSKISPFSAGVGVLCDVIRMRFHRYAL